MTPRFSRAHAMEFGQLDQLLTRINGEIAHTESELMKLHAELTKLKQQARALEDTRAMLVAARPTAESYRAHFAKAELAVTTLQDEILRQVQKLSAAEPVSVMTVVISLRSSGHPSAENKNFYPTVFTTMKRLVDKGKLVEYSDCYKKRYFRLKDTEGWHASVKEHA